MEEKFVITCDSCHRKLRVKAEHSGKKIRCPGCQALIDALMSAEESTEDVAERKRPPRKAGPVARRKPTPEPSVSDDMWLDDSDQDFGNPDDWKDEHNPYAAPRSETRVPSRIAMRGFGIDGKLIRCGPELQLPPICVYTGATSNLTAVSKKLKHFPMWAYLVGGVILAVLMQKSCRVSWFVSKAEKSRRLKMLLICLATIGVGLLILVLGATSNIPELFVLVGIVVMLGGLITTVVSQQSLRITKRDGGKIFWIGGFEPAFFETLARRS